MRVHTVGKFPRDYNYRVTRRPNNRRYNVLSRRVGDALREEMAAWRDTEYTVAGAFGRNMGEDN